MKQNKYIGFAMVVAGMLWATSCSDFTDYNETPVADLPAGNQTLWENISGNPQLRNFAALVQRTGFDSLLSQPRAYTIWAPVDGKLDATAYQGMSDSLLLQQFVKNHVSEFVHGASGSVNERIHTLNKKSFSFIGDGAYTFGDIAVSQANLPSSNGIIHLLDGVVTFHPNLFEYLSTGEKTGLLTKYFMQYNDTTLSSESVKGPIVNGVQTYLDSVLVVNNSLLRYLNAKIENEDSSYTFVMPTDEAYQKMYDRVKPLYRFIETTTVQDVAQFTTATGSQTRKITVDADFLSDSLTRRAIVQNLIFSNTDGYNQWVVGKGSNTDTLRTTNYRKLSNPGDILNKYLVGSPLQLSNGYARLVDSLAFYPWETFNQEISINPRLYIDNIFSATVHNQSVPDTLAEKIFGKEAGISNFRYAWVEPNSTYAKPDFFVTLPNVKSATYNFYAVFLPSAMPQLGNDSLSSWLNFQLNYCKENGNLDNYFFSKPLADSLLTGGVLPEPAKAASTQTAFANDPLKTDTVFLGRFTFPVAYSGLNADNDYRPNIRITTPINVFSPTDKAKYTRNVRLAAIILKPIEYDEFEANKK